MLPYTKMTSILIAGDVKVSSRLSRASVLNLDGVALGLVIGKLSWTTPK